MFIGKRKGRVKYSIEMGDLCLNAPHGWIVMVIPHGIS